MNQREPPVAVLWAAVTLLAFLAVPLQPWTVSAFALGAAVSAAALRRPSQRAFAVGLVALAGAPRWVGAVGPALAWSPWVVVGGATLLLGLSRTRSLLTRQYFLPASLPWLVLAVGLVEAARQAAAGLQLEAAGRSAGWIALIALSLSGEVAGARRARSSVLALGLVGLLGLGRAGLAARATPSDAGGVRSAAALGVLRLHAEALAARPELGLEALRADPTLHGLALALMPSLGPQAVLETGWHAEQAPLSPAQRLSLAAALDAVGEGGRAVRVLRPGRADPEVAWRFALMERQIGRAVDWEGPPPPSLSVADPSGWAVPGRVELGWMFMTNGAQTLDFHAMSALTGLSVEARGQPLNGPAEVEVRLDHAPPMRVALPEVTAALPITGALAAGPHRLRVSFVNDLSTETGDRNAVVIALIGAP